MRVLKFPAISSTHMVSDGVVNDQPALNYLIAGGIVDQEFLAKHGHRIWNSVNGYIGNPDRKPKYFHYSHAPGHKWRIPMTYQLLSPAMRRIVHIVPQGRLNCYPVRFPGTPISSLAAPMMHYPRDMKGWLLTALGELDGER